VAAVAKRWLPDLSICGTTLLVVQQEESMKIASIWWKVGGALGAIASVVLLTGLGAATPQSEAADPGIEAGVRATANTIVYAYNQGDFGVLSTFLTDEAFEGLFDTTKAEVAADDTFFGEQVELRSVHDIEETDDGATAVVEVTLGLGVQAWDMVFVQESLRWKVTDAESTSPTPPAGARTVAMNMQEFAFVYDRSAVSSGNFVLQARNVGAQEHEVVLIKPIDNTISTGDLVELLSSGDESGPPPFDAFGFLGFAPPGDSFTAVLAEPLANGKYFFLCFIPDSDGIPHAAKGMISEFTVGPAIAAPATPTGAITPPSTGDAGLSTENSTAAGVAGLVILAAALGFGISRRRLAGR
jgi:hypothetical protein